MMLSGGISGAGPSVLLGLVVLTLLIISIVFTEPENERLRPWKEGYDWLVILAAVVAVGVVTVDPATQFFTQLVNRPVAFVIVGVIAGAALFGVRLFRKDVYGALEMIVAVLTLGLCAETAATNLVPTAIGFVGAVYVLVRGLTNVADGRLEIVQKAKQTQRRARRASTTKTAPSSST
jgi:hypothetical protein